LDIIFNENDNEHDNFFKDKYLPNITLNINVIEFDNQINNSMDFLTYEDENKERNNNILNLVENMEKELKIYNEKIKKNINNTIKNDYLKFILINNLNEIQSMIKLFKNNYEDIKEIL
jgi:hypothetical protein